jgi:hypothetical protein
MKKKKAFFYPHYRAWELLTGCVAALIKMDVGSEKLFKGTLKWLPECGLIAALAAIAFMDSNDFPGIKTAVPVMGIALYIVGRRHDSVAAHMLSHRTAVFWGKSSYSVYLWHWPSLVIGLMLSQLFNSHHLFVFVVGAGLVLAMGSYSFVEKFGRKTASPVYALGLSIAAIFTLVYLNLSADPIPKAATTASWHGNIYTVRPTGLGQTIYSAGHVYPAPNPRPGEWWKQPNEMSKGAKTVVLLGDSHALMWANEIAEECGNLGHGFVSFAADGLSPLLGGDSSGVLPSTQSRFEFDGVRLRYIAENKPAAVLIAVRYESYGEDEIAGMRKLIDAIKAASPNSKLALVEQPPVLPIGNKSAPDYFAWQERLTGAVQPNAVKPFERASLASVEYERMAAKSSNVTWLSTRHFLLREGNIVIKAEDGKFTYFDDDHLSSEGAEYAGGEIAAFLRDI